MKMNIENGYKKIVELGKLYLTKKESADFEYHILISLDLEIMSNDNEMRYVERPFIEYVDGFISIAPMRIKRLIELNAPIQIIDVEKMVERVCKKIKINLEK